MGFTDGRLVRVSLEAVHNSGDTQVNTFHYDLVDNDVTGIANDPQALADRFRDDVIPHFKSIYDNNWTIQPVVVSDEKDPQNPGGPRQQWVSGSPIAGSYFSSGDLLPRACCTIAHVKSDHIGRRATGRLFVGGSPTEAAQAAGSWVGEWLGTIQPYIDNIPRAPDIAEGDVTSHAFWCVYSRTNRSQDVSPYSFGVVSAAYASKVHWLRSREQ